MSNQEKREPKEFTTTNSGFRLPAPAMGLPKQTQSFCPECSRKIPALVHEVDGKVLMSKQCPDHGAFEDVVYSSLDHYFRMETFRFSDGRGVSNPTVTESAECPESCGLCRRHASHTALANVDLTNRCNLRCPVCFANANAAGYLYEPDLAQVRGILQRFRDEKPVPCACVQFAGGEPTLHPNFFEILSMARDLGFSAVQVATNGLRMLEPGFAEKCRDAGLNSVYLQWDSMDDEAYRKMRGAPLLEDKLRIIENIKAAGMVNVILVPTIVKGVNDGQIGPILEYAVRNVDIVTGVSFQPVAMTGRISPERRRAGRFTLSELAEEVERQTGFARAGGWAPLSALVPLSRLASALEGRPVTAYTAHHHCSMATYLFVEPSGRPVQINEFFDFPALLRDINGIAADLEASRFKFVTRSLSKLKALGTLERHFKRDRAPEGLTFEVFFAAVEQLMSSKQSRRKGQGFAYRTLMVGGMHFMDSYNFDVERVQRCVVHYGAPDGKIYPFCAYNAGPTYRTQIERKVAHTRESVRRIAESEGFPRELQRLVEDELTPPPASSGCAGTAGAEGS